MSGRQIAPQSEQPDSFAFTAENLAKAEVMIGRYPDGCAASAVLPLLDLAQRQQGGWLPTAAIRHVGDTLGMSEIRAFEVATFYTMFNLAPVGKYLIQLCRTTPCWLCGSDDLRQATERHLGIGLGQTTADGLFSLMEVECLGACVNAPIVQINDDMYEDLTGARMVELLDALRAGETPPHGSQIARQKSAPLSGPTTLTELDFAES